MRDWIAGARSCGRALLDLVYPPACPACGAAPAPDADHPAARSIRWPSFCLRCRTALRETRPPFCQVCGETFPEGAPDDLRCSNCGDRRFHFRFARAACENRGPVRELIHRFKYNDQFHLRTTLAVLADAALDDPRIEAIAPVPEWILVPVPLHPRRRRERGYNQSEELCRLLARRRGAATFRALRRTRYTGAQAGLGRSERLSNLRGAFVLRRRFTGPGSPLAGRHVLLVDDVFTTGATTEECARVLTGDGGVQNVVVITVARG